MNRKMALVVLIVTQLAVSSWMTASQEHILKKGTAYRFKTAPVDPYDIFRGRYVALSTDVRRAVYNGQQKPERGEDIYVILENDEKGFARAKEAVTRKPNGHNYIKAKATYQNSDRDVNFELPLNRFYMNEDKAPMAEALYRRAVQRGRQEAYIVVRVLNGKASIENLYIADQPIESYF